MVKYGGLGNACNVDEENSWTAFVLKVSKDNINIGLSEMGYEHVGWWNWHRNVLSAKLWISNDILQVLLTLNC
jgi:hypothetical protein